MHRPPRPRILSGLFAVMALAIAGCVALPGTAPVAAEEPVPSTVSFEPTLQIKSYVWVPEDEAQALVPDGWIASCHEYVFGVCAFRGLFAEVTIDYVEYSAATIGNVQVPGGKWAAILLNVEPPSAIAESPRDITDVDQILLGIFTTEPTLYEWFAAWGLASAPPDTVSLSVTHVGVPGVGSWVSSPHVAAGAFDMKVTQPHVGVVYWRADHLHARMYVYDEETGAQPTHYLRQQQELPILTKASRGRGVAEGTLPGFSDSHWKDDHAWVEPRAIRWSFQPVPQAAASEGA